MHDAGMPNARRPLFLALKSFSPSRWPIVAATYWWITSHRDAARAFPIAPDKLAARWDLTAHRLLSPGDRATPLTQIKTLNTRGGGADRDPDR